MGELMGVASGYRAVFQTVAIIYAGLLLCGF